MDIKSFGPGLLYPVALSIMLFSMRLTLKVKDFIGIFKKPKAVSLGLAGQILFLPSVSFLIVMVTPLPPEAAIGLIILSDSLAGAYRYG